MDACVKQWLKQEVQTALPTRRGAGGTKTLAERRTLKAYFETQQRQEATGQGFEFVTRHVVITEEQINRGERIWLVGIDNTDGAGREVLQTEAVYDFTTGLIDHYETLV